MKRLHRPDLWAWSRFDEARNIDFHGYAWIRAEGNVLVDPVLMLEHDREHLRSLGGAAIIVITNSDHVRDAEMLATTFDAELVGPAGERDDFPIACARWLSDGDEVVPGLIARALDGSKTPGELALVLEDTTLITGDLIRCHEGGLLRLLPDPKLLDRDAAIASVRRLVEEHTRIDAVLLGDGWPIFHDGHSHLRRVLD